MTERQQNSKVLADKLSQIPVPANDLLWGKLESQLLAAQPTQPTPKHSAYTHQAVIKLVVIIVSATAIALLTFWLMHNQKQVTSTSPAKQQIPAPIKKNTTSDTVIPGPIQQKQNTKPGITPQVQPTQDTVIKALQNEPATLGRRSVDMPSVKDSVNALVPSAVIDLKADSAKLKPQAIEKKNDDYYFEIKKKKGNE